MTKQIKKTGKRSLAVFLSILMLMTSWVFVAPTKADAADSQYSWTLRFHLDDGRDVWDNDSSYIGLYYKPNNGTGGWSGLDKVYTGEGYFQDGGDHDISGTSSDFPCYIEIHAHRKYRWGTDNFQAHITLWVEGVCILNNADWNPGSDHYDGTWEYTWDCPSTSYPYISSNTWSGATTVDIPLTGTASSTQTYGVTTVDNYDVNWVNDPTWSVDNNNTTKEKLGTTNGKSASVTFYNNNGVDYTTNVNVSYDTANSSHTPYTSSRAVTVHARHTLTVNPDGGNWSGSTTNQTFYGHTGDTKALTRPTRYGYEFDGWTVSNGSMSGDTFTYQNKATATVTAKWKKVNFTATFAGLKNNDGTNKANATQSVPYQDTPTPAANITASAYNSANGDYTYTFSGWSPALSGITADTTYTAQYTETSNPADYSAVDAAIAAANTRKGEQYYANKYTAASRTALQAALDAVVRGKLQSEQQTVNGYATAINNAIAGLTLNTYTVQFLNEGVVVDTQYNILWGTGATEPSVTATKAPDPYYHYIIRPSGEGGTWDVAFNNVTHLNTNSSGILTVNVVYVPRDHDWTTEALAATCIHGSGQTTTCPTCSYVLSQSSTDLDPDNHEAQYIVERVKTEPTCTTAGQKANYCTACDTWLENTTTIPALGHSWNRPGTVITAPNCTDTGTIQYTCARCNITTTDTLPVVADAHTWGNTATWSYGEPNATTGAMTATATLVCTHNANHTKEITITVYPTANTADCENGGTWSYAPSVTFGDTTYSTTTTKPSPELGHDIVEVPAVAATCETAGNSKYYRCMVCGKLFDDEEGTTETTAAAHNIPATGHDWATDEPEWSWEKNGDSYKVTAYFICHKDNGHQRAVNATVEKLATSTDATCTADGTAKFKATATLDGVTKTATKDDTLPKLGHDWGEWSVTTPAGCETTGVETRVCGNDSAHKETRDIPATGHNFGDWTDNDNEDTHIRTCSNNTNHTETEPHDYKDIVSAAARVDATAELCTAGVEYYKTCAVCGHISTDANNTFFTQTAGHKLVKANKVEATCTTAGHEAYWQCAVCSKFFSDANATTEINGPVVIDALGHDFDLTATPVETTGGHMYPCTRCGGYGFGNALGNTEPHTFDQQNRGNRYIAGTATDCGQTATYYYSCKCGAVGTTTFSDPSGSINHNLTAHPAIAATCAEPGRIAYWECSKCHRLFKDANGTTEVHADELSVPKTTTHSFGEWTVLTAATCTEQGSETRTCSVCGKVETRTTDALEHSFTSTTYKTYNNGTHSIKCIRCDVYGPAVACTNTTSTSTAADCTHKGTTTYTCSDCGGSWTVENAYGNHQTTLVAGKAADCTTAGTKDYYKCSVCGKMFADAAGSTEYATVDELVIQPLGHALTAVEAVAATCLDGGHETYYTCSRCNKIFRDALGQYQMESADEANTDALGHDWGEWTVLAAATCEADGSQRRECARCHAVETEAIPATGHAYPDAWTADGETGHKKVCGNDASHELTEAHTWTNIVDASKKVAGTTCETGIQYYKTCSVCGYTSTTETFTVAEAGHKLVLHEATEATCGEAGNSAYYECSQCGKFFSDENATTEIEEDSWVIPALEHDWNTTNPAWYWVKTEGGYDVMAVFTCKNNGDHQKSARAAATPTETDATCTTGGSVTWTATVNFEGETYTAEPRTETVDALGHQMGDWTVTKEATCDEAGVETRTCQRDGCTYSETREIAKLTHKLVYVPAVAPTCTEDGSIAHYQCALCGKYFSDAAGTTVLSSIIDPATGHDFTGAYKDNGDGTHSRLCVNGCGTYGDPVSHTYDQQNAGANYAVNGQAADCTSEGHYYYSCVCGACENDDEHTFTAGGSLGHVLHEIEAVAATCKADGHDAYWYCSRCGKYFTDNTAGTETTPAAHIISHSTVAHTWGDWTEKTAPTCTTIGKDERTCSVCGLVETRDVPVIAHDYTGAVVTYNNGTHAHKCKYDCGMVGPIENCTRTIKSTTAADCVHLGTTTYKCDVCGYEWTEEETGVGPHSSTPTHHDAVPATCTTAGSIEYWTCELCGKNFSDADCTSEVTDITVAALNHAGIFAVEQQNADCTTDGVKMHFKCPICNKLFSDATAAHEVNADDLKIPMLGHNFYGALKDNEDGTHSFKCTRCDAYGNDEAHTFDRKVVNNDTLVSDANCLNPAKYHYTCACGAIDTEGTAGTFDNGQPTGHAYNSVKAGSWVWTKSGETYTVTATVVCANDAGHEETRNAVVTFTTDAPNCTDAGTRHYIATITLDDGTTATDNKDEEVEKVGHSLVETAAVEETCETDGNSKYYTCSVCHKYFSDAAGTTEIDADSWVIPAKGHDFDYANATYVWNDTLTEVVATAICKNDTSHKEVVKSTAVTSAVKTPATCTEKGTTTYTAAFDSPFATQTKDVQDIAKIAHDLTKTEAVEATCTVEGFDAYWTCSECGKIFSDENGDHEISEVAKALDPDNHVALVHTAKVDATCQANGNIEYWTCNDCHQKLVYNDEGKLVVVTDVVIPAGPEHHRFTTHVSAKDATCTQQGNVEYWTCSVCGKHYDGNTADANELTTVSTDPLGHDVTRTAAVAPTCTTDGNLEYWYCARCHQYFLADSITAEPVAFSATVDPKKGHTSVSVDAVAVQCEADGNKAYTYCSVCDTILTLDGVDVSLNGWTKSGNSSVYTITQTGHAYGDPTWVWNDDHTSATATRICANDASHTLTETDNDIDTVVVPKTHTTDGKTTYTAEGTFAFDSKTYTDVVEVVDTASGHHTTKVNAKEATCEEAGNLEYWICNDEGCGKLFKDENALVETTLAEVTIDALGHNYVNPTWTWTQNGNFYTGATLTFTCANNADHKQTPEVTFTANQTDPDCTNAGKIVYTATATFEGKTYTDTKEVALEKTGHTLTSTAAKDATCEEAGNIAYWTCSVCNKIFSDENARYEITEADTVIAALGHTYDYAHTDYDWSADHSSCTATATCIRCDATDTETKASTNDVKIPATCEAQGIRIYTVDFDNENFATQTYDELIPANGHGTAVAHEGEEATCEEAGFEAYWTCSVCGKLFKAETLTAENEIANPIVIPATGHDWDYTKANVTYTWSETEPYTCTATVTCKNDGNHTKDVTGSVTITASTEADCTTDGSRTYTATFPADTKIPNDTKTATTSALRHDFSESVDRAHVVDGTHHNYKCVRCDAYGIGTGESAEVNGSVACTFHGDWYVSDNESCTEAGSEWRQCDFCSNKETREREALTHQVFSVAAQEATCVAIGNKAYTYCERCGLLLTVDGNSVETQNIKFNSAEAIALYKTEDMLNHDLKATAAKAATCEEDGNIAYWTCERCGKIFNTATPTSNEAAITLADTVIAATKHVFTGAVRDNGDNTHSKQCTKCEAYGIMVNGTPVKDGKEACYGGTATCTADAVCTVCGHVYQTKLGHNYVLQSWTWNGYTAATAHYVCTRDAEHTKDVEATVNKTDATVTCTTAGQNTYVATATFTDGDKTYTDTDTKTEVVNATGHNWDFENAVYSWDANQNCTVTLKCLNDAEHIYTEIGKNTTETTPATCEGTGSVKYTATFTINSSLTSEHTETLAALGHKWGDPAWTWTGNDTDGYTATVKLVCDRVASHVATPEVTVTKDTVAPTCEKDGRVVYTATATLDGRTYKDTKITIQPATGHDWQAPVFIWTEAETGGYSAAIAMIACNNDHAHDQTLNCALTTETDDATCTEGGTVTYTATVTFNGRTYTDTKTAEVTALGHKYEFVDFTWTGNDADGYTAAVANFKCANDPTHTTTADATVTTETVEAICEADGKTTYTATVTFEGKDYTDEKVVVIPMLHHNWGDATYTWVKDGDQYKVTALRVCANNEAEHQQTVTVTTTSEITAGSGCESEGVMLYTATFEAPFATQTREEAIGVAGHTLVHTAYLDSTCTEDGNIEYWRCSVCGKIFTNEAATADAYLGTDLAATVIAAKNHDFVMEGSSMVVLDNEDGTHSFKCSRCDAYGAVIDGAQKEKADGGVIGCVYGDWKVTRKATCMDPGEQEATCKICRHVGTREIGYADHVIIKIAAKAATCEADGNKEYFKCNVCGKLFADAAATTETTLEAVKLPKLGHNFTGTIHNDGNGTTHSYLCVNGCGTYGNPQAHEFDQQIASNKYLRNVATCTEPATYYLSCKCGQASTQTFTKGNALGHNDVVYTGQPATCTQAGHTEYTECTRCHRRDGYQVLDALNHGAYLPDGTGSSADGSLKWTVYKCDHGCGDYYVVLNVTSIDAQGTRVPNVKVTITGNNTNITGTTDGNGDLKLTDEAKNRLMPGVYTVALEYVRDGSNYNTRGTITVKDDTVTGSYGKLTPYGGNASGSIGGEPTGEFRCSMCSTYESAKNVPVYGWFISIIHFFVHAISRIAGGR